MRLAAKGRILLLVLIALGPSAVRGEEVALGDRVLVLDPAAWQAATLVPGKVARLTCLAADCRRAGGGILPDLYALSFSAGSGVLTTCSAAQGSIPITETEDGPFMQHSAAYAGIEFNVLGLISECARQRPVLLHACGLHEGTLYWLTTSFSGCSPEPDLPEARFEEILESLSRQSSAVQ